VPALFLAPNMGDHEGRPYWRPMADIETEGTETLYCPNCETEIDKPLVCGDCAAVICRMCGTPLEKMDELGMG